MKNSLQKSKCPYMERKFPIETPKTRDRGNSGIPAANEIQKMTLDEIFDLFHLSYDMTLNDLKQAKQKVLMLHPDKSNLPPEYFIFYKRAYERVVEVFEDLQKQNRPITKEATKYNSQVIKGRESVFKFAESPEVLKSIEKQSKTGEFNKTFNELFEKNMVKNTNTTRNEWFTNEESEYNLEDKKVNKGNMAAIIEDIKEKSAAALMVHRGGFNELYSRNSGVSHIFDEDGEGGKDHRGYISSDVFDKLKFEDIRRVHKDETVIPIRQADCEKAQGKTMTVDQYLAHRSSTQETPMAKVEAERILAQKEMMEKEMFMKKQYKSKMISDEYENKNNEIMAHFLKIKNG